MVSFITVSLRNKNSKKIQMDPSIQMDPMFHFNFLDLHSNNNIQTQGIEKAIISHKTAKNNNANCA